MHLYFLQIALQDQLIHVKYLKFSAKKTDYVLYNPTEIAMGLFWIFFSGFFLKYVLFFNQL